MRGAWLLALLLSAAPAAAQAPFDMSGERPPATAPSLPAPPATPPAASGPALLQPGIGQSALSPAKRFFVPFGELVLAGERAQRSWSVFLTPEQATAGTQLHLGYQNALVVAPETSRMTVSINGTRVLDEPIAAPDRVADIVAAVPPGVLRAGLNDVVLSASQRHRTDCSVASTYELWTQLDLARTFFSFEGAQAGHWRRVEDIRAIGVDGSGTTTFNLIVPTMAQPMSMPQTVRLGEALALMANMPNQAFEVSEAGAPAAGPGRANVVLGPASDIAKVLAAVPAGAETGPVATLVDDPKLGPSTLVVSGPNWQAVEMAIDDIARQVDRPAQSLRASLGTRNWRTPDVPMLFGAGKLTFADLGVNTLEFSGRRVSTDFAIGVPSDFYAGAYGQATILLDAAYAQDVLPGSHIDVYVNDNIAATVPIATAGGGILRHLPIKVTMRHFRPGDNTIAIEAVLLTQADAVCAPGASSQGGQRFAIFDTSEFLMPDFARVARTPDLAAIGGTGFPYGRADYALPLIIDRAQPETVSAGVTLLARMSVVAGRLIAVDAATAASTVGDRNALFIGAFSQVPPAALEQVGVSDNSSSTWGQAVVSTRPNTEATFDEWREKLRGSGWRGQISSFEDWMKRTFNISMDSFRILPGKPADYTPQGSAGLLVAQQASPTAGGTWTVVTAPSASALRAGVRTLTQQRTWRQLGGHLATVDSGDGKVVTLPVTRFDFVQTQPFSFANYRLIAANWLSANALSYAVVLTLLSIVLGLATAGLLGSLGRRR